MPKKANYSYTRSQRSPSERKKVKQPGSFTMPMNKPKGVSEITEYVEGELQVAQEGEKLLDLVREFQEEVCDHPRRVEVASGPSFKLMKCSTCGDIQRQEKKHAA